MTRLNEFDLKMTSLGIFNLNGRLVATEEVSNEPADQAKDTCRNPI